MLFHFSRCSRIWARGEFFPLDLLSKFCGFIDDFWEIIVCLFSLPPLPHFILSHSMNWMLPQISQDSSMSRLLCCCRQEIKVLETHMTHAVFFGKAKYVRNYFYIRMNYVSHINKIANLFITFDT